MKEKKTKGNSKKIVLEEVSNNDTKEYKSATFTKRLSAYIIDILLLGIVFSVFTFIIPVSEKAKTINEEILEVQTKYLDKKITIEEYESQLTPLNYDYSKETYISSLISLVLTILYFVVYQYKNKRTFGKKIMGIEVKKDAGEGELQVNDFIIRSLIVNSLFSNILTLSILFFLSKKNYTLVSSYTTVIQFALIMTTGLFMIIRKDKRSLHDIITKTRVVEAK